VAIRPRPSFCNPYHDEQILGDREERPLCLGYQNVLALDEYSDKHTSLQLQTRDHGQELFAGD